MDQDRQIRLLIPPFFFLASLAFIVQASGIDLLSQAKGFETEQLIALGGALGAAALPGGYLLTGITTLGLHLWATKWMGWPTYEAHVSDEALQRIWLKVGRLDSVQRSAELFAVATFDHQLLSEGIHTWLMRRWNAFNVAVSSVVAVLLAIAVAARFVTPCGWALFCPLVACTIIGSNGWRAWRDTMAMVEFQALLAPSCKPGSEPANPPLQPTSGAERFRPDRENT